MNHVRVASFVPSISRWMDRTVSACTSYPRSILANNNCVCRFIGVLNVTFINQLFDCISPYVVFHPSVQERGHDRQRGWFPSKYVKLVTSKVKRELYFWPCDKGLFFCVTCISPIHYVKCIALISRTMACNMVLSFAQRDGVSVFTEIVQKRK